MADDCTQYQGIAPEDTIGDVIAVEDLTAGIGLDYVIPDGSETLRLVIERLREDSQLQGFVGQKVYNQTPQDLDYPYVVVSISATEFHTKMTNGEEQIITCEIWSNQHGDKEALKIKHRIQQLLHARPFEGLIAQSLLIEYTGWTAPVQTDGATNYSAVTFRHIATG